MACAQSGLPQPGTQVRDAGALKPPAGARVALVVFSDMECPACASANPLLRQAAAKYGIPLVRHDVLIPGHNWSQAAAVNARWLDERGKGLGDQYRDAVFANQASIFSPLALRQFTEKFARSHGVSLPFNMDPQGKLAAAVQADNGLAQRTGVWQTPAIFVVMARGGSTSYAEVVDRSRLYQMIDQALSATRAAAPARARHK